jgi:hypothetical protein
MCVQKLIVLFLNFGLLLSRTAVPLSNVEIMPVTKTIGTEGIYSIRFPITVFNG